MLDQTRLKVLATMVASIGFLAAVAQAQEGSAKQACSHERHWRPNDEELKQILSDHQQWLKRREASSDPNWEFQNPQGRADLCNADLIGVELNNANLMMANLDNALLWTARLDEADLTVAKLNNANLSAASLYRANLSGAELNSVFMPFANLYEANLTRAQIKDAVLAYTILADVVYAPASPPPNAYVAGIKGLETLRFPKGEEVGLVQLRELLQKAGLRNEERQVTYSIEKGKTQHALADWREIPSEAAEGLFRLVAFDWTTAYGLHPVRALTVLAVLWTLLIPVYWWTIRNNYLWPTGFAGIYRIWPKDRIEAHEGIPALEGAAKVERLHADDLAALGWSAWFSLLSAFHIGFREFSVGSWLSRVHPRQFTLEATGWVRTVSGLQSLISLYLLAMWVLTYFGRPFQ
jgi:hypothetical protein